MAEEFDDNFDELDDMLAGEGDISGLEDPTDNPDDVSRSVVTSMDKALKSNLDTEKIGNNLRNSILKSMPGDMGEGLDKVIDIGDTVLDKIEKPINSARKSTASTLSDLSEILPDFLGSSVKSLSNFIKPESDSYDSERELTEDEKIANSVNELFGEVKTKENILNSINETTNTFLNKDNNELLSNIVSNTRTALDLKIDIDNKYYRKDLELQMKQTLTLVSMLDIMKRDSEIRTKQMEAIVKNTGLPDFAKNRGSDFVKEMLIKDASNIGLNAFKSTSVFDKASKNFSMLINDKIAGFVNATNMLEGGIDAAKMAEENGGIINTVVEQGVDSVVSKGTDAATKLAMNKIIESQGGADKIKDLEKFLSDPELAMEAFLKDQEEQQQKEDLKDIGNDKNDGFFKRIYKGAKRGLKNVELDAIRASKEALAGAKTRVSYDLEDTSKLGEAQFLDGKLKKSIEYVIPNILGKLLAETTTIRKKMGVTSIDKKDEIAFNYNSNSFESKEKTLNKIEKSIDDKATSLVNLINEPKLIKAFAGSKKLSDEERQDFISGMMNYLLDGKTTGLRHMKDQGFLDYFNNEDLKSKVTKGLKKLTTGMSNEKVKIRSNLKKELDNIQVKGTSSYKDIADKVNKTTDNTLLQDIGLTTEENGNKVSSKAIKDINKKYANEVISRIKDGKVTEDDKYKNADGKIIQGFAKGGPTDITPDIMDDLKVFKDGDKETPLKTTAGPTGDGEKLEVAGVTHKNEYVVSEDKLKSLIKDVKTGDEESIIDKVTTMVNEVAKDAKSTKSYDYLNKKVDTATTRVSELANQATNYFNNTFKEKPKVSAVIPYTPVTVTKLTNFKDSKYKSTEDMFSSVKKDVESLITDLTTNISKTRKSVTDEFTKFTDILPKSFDETTTLFNTKFKAIKDSLPKSFDEIDFSIKDLSKGISTGLTSITNMIPDSIKNTMSSYLEDTKKLGIILKEDLKTVTGIDLDNTYENVTKYGNKKLTKAKKYTKDKTGVDIDKEYTNAKNYINKTSKEDMIKDAKDVGNNIINSTTNFVNDMFSNKPNINATAPFNQNTNNIGKVSNFKEIKSNNPLDKLAGMFKSLTDSFTKTGDNIETNLEKNSSTFESLTKKLPNLDDISGFFNETGTFINSLIKSNDKLDGVKLPENLTDKDKQEEKDEVGIVNKTFTNATKAVSSGFDTIKNMFSDKDMSEEMASNIKAINKDISEGHLDSVIYEALMETPLPKNYPQAVHLYRKIFTGIDPSGKLWTKLNEDSKFISKIEKIHIEAIEKGQRGLLEKTGDVLDKGIDKAGGLVGTIRDKILGLLPAPVRKYVEPLLKNRFTKFGAKTLGRAKKIFKGAGMATLSELGNVGKNVKEAFIGKDGKVRLPNAYDLVKLTGKTAYGTSKALSIGIKTLYPELFGLAKDTVGLGTKTLWDFLGIKKASKRAMAKMKAIIIPPIDRKLYRDWTKGKLTSKEVMDKLKTEKDQIIWAKWLKDNTRPGITLPEIMMQSGRWYMKTMYGVASGVKATAENKTVRKTVGGLAKGILKGTWNFVKPWHSDDSKKEDIVTKPEKSELTFTDLIDEDFIEVFVEQVANINDELKVDNASLLNKPINSLKQQQANKLVRLMKEINDLYISMDKYKDNKVSKIIDKKIAQLLTYVNTIKTLKKKPTKVKDKVKDVIDKEYKKTNTNDKKDKYNKDNELEEDKSIIDSVKSFFKSKDEEEIPKPTLNDDIKEEKPKKKTDNKKSTKKDKVKSSTKENIKSEEKEKTSILSSFKESLTKITDSFSKKIDEVEVKKDDKPKFSPFDHDKDGDRDGNRLDRMKKLYGKTKDKVKKIGTTVINKVKDKKSSLLSTLIMFAPVLIGMFKKIFKPIIAIAKGIKNAIFGIGDTIGNVMSKTVAGVTSAITSIKHTIGKTLASKIINPVKNVVSKVITGAKNIGSKVVSPITNIVKKAPKGKIAKFLQTLRVLKKKVLKKLGAKAGAKILSKISAKLIPGIGLPLLAWDLGWVAKYMIDGLSWKSAISKQITGYDFFKDDDKKEETKVKDIMNKDKVDNINKPNIISPDNNPVNNINFTKNDANRFKKKDLLVNNLNYKNKQVPIDTEGKPKDNHKKDKTFSVGNIAGRDGNLFSPDGGDNNITHPKNVDINNLNPTMKSLLFGMANEYNHITGKTIPINSAFRSYAYQAALKRKYGSKAATPGKSTHEYGLAVDMNSSTANELDKLGLMKKYGFTRPVGEETWHVEPAGIQIDVNKSKHNLALANKLTKYSVGKGGEGWGTKKGTRKYSRNLKYQLELMKAKGTLIPDNKTIVNKVIKDKTLLDKNKKDNVNNKQLLTHNDIVDKTTTNKTNIKINDSKPKTVMPNINIKTPTVNNSKDFDKIHKGNEKQSGILEKSLKVQYNTYEKMSELVDINKSMLSVLQSSNGNHSTNKQKNNSNYNLPAHNDAISHGVKDY